MEIAPTIGAMALLLAAAVVFQLFWYTALAFLIWAPPACVGVVAGYMTYTASESILLSIFIAVLAHRATRCAMNSVALRLLGMGCKGVN